MTSALPGLSLLIWVAMWFTPTGLIEDWLRNDFVGFGKNSKKCNMKMVFLKEL